MVLFFIFISIAVAQDRDREYEKMIFRYDVAYIFSSSEGLPEDFWRQLERGHNGLLSFNKALTRGKKTALEAESDISRALGVVDNQYRYLYLYEGDTIKDFTHDIQEIVLGCDANRIRLHIAYGEVPNAFCTPRGDIYIYTTLLDRLDFDWRMLVGICAHEVAHYYLKHSARQIWADKKAERKNNILAGIAIGLTAVADVMSAYNAGYSGTQYQSPYTQTYQNILSSAQTDTQLFHFKYSRGEELEADIIAYRYLEYMGIDPYYYIKALYSLGNDGDAFYSDWSDHPSITYRINLLRYLGQYYPLKSVISCNESKSKKK